MAQVTMERHGKVAVVRLDDGKANALRASLLGELDAALDAAGDAGAVLLTGRPGFFSAGLDLKLLPTLGTEEKLATFHAFCRVAMRLYDFGRPTVAALTGHAIAGGGILALACDARIAGGTGRLGLSEVAIGIPLPSFSLDLVRDAVPGHLVTEVALHGRLYSFEEARDRGLVEALVAPDALFGAAMERAEALARIPSAPYAMTKDRLRGARIRAAQASLDDEVATFVRFFEARPPGVP